MKSAFLILSLFFFLVSCTESDESAIGFKYLDIENANGIILGKYTHEADSTLKLFKFTTEDHLEEINFLNDAKSKVNTERIPVSFYDLNSSYFLLNLTFGNKKTEESFLVRKFDGKIQKLNFVVSVDKDGVTDWDSEAIRKDNVDGFYFSNTDGNWKLDLSNPADPKLTSILSGENLDSDFCVDYSGNMITQTNIYLNNGLSGKIGSGTHLPVNSYSNLVYYMDREEDSIKCYQVDVSAGTIGEKKLIAKISLPFAQSELITSHAFSGLNTILVVMNGAILKITDSEVQSLNMNNLNLTSIASCHFSKSYAFIYGTNAVENRVFIRLDPSSGNSAFTQIFAPNEEAVHLVSGSYENNLFLTAIRSMDQKTIFAYIPYSGNNHLIPDDLGITEKQIIVR